MPPKKEAPKSSGEKAAAKKLKAKENTAKANPELAARNKEASDAKRERRKESGSSKVSAPILVASAADSLLHTRCAVPDRSSSDLWTLVLLHRPFFKWASAQGTASCTR